MKRMAMFDWNAMKCFHLRLFLIPIISLAAGFISALLVVPTNVFMFLFFSVNTFAVEEKGDLNKLYLTLPVKRSAVVAGRYVLSICMGVAGLVTGIPLAILADRFSFPGKDETITHAQYSAAKRAFGTSIPQNFPLL